MFSVRDLPLARKLTLIVALTTVVGMAITSLASMVYQVFTFTNFMIVELGAVTEVLGKNGTAALRFQARSDAENTLSSLRAKDHISGAVLLNTDGSILASYVRDDSKSIALPAVIKEGWEIDYQILTWTRHIHQDDDFIGSIYVESELDELYVQVAKSAVAMLLITLAAAALALLLGFKFLRVVSEPIDNLIDTANRVSKERDYSLRATKYADDDLGQLSLEFNEMLNEIEQRDAEMEQRVAQRTEELSRANSDLSGSLQEKVVLLKEIHHRVKNNLQVITSLLNLQARDIVDESAQKLFINSQSRVQTMALIHERLYQSDNLSKVNFAEYIPALVDSLFSTYKTGSQEVDLQIDVEELMIELDQAIPCGLIVNELMSNALKYAFPEERSGTIVVQLHALEDNMLELNVSDNGIGLPEEVGLEAKSTLGWQLLNILTRQMRGALEVLERRQGVHFRITFPLMLESTTKNMV